MRFHAGYPKAPRDFPPRKDGIPHSRSGCLETSLPLPQSLYGRSDGWTYADVTTKIFRIDTYQISLAMELLWRALPAGSAIIILMKTRSKLSASQLRMQISECFE